MIITVAVAKGGVGKSTLVRALASEIIQQNGTRIAGEEMPYRIAYKDMQTGTTLYAGGRVDSKAIAESEAIFAEIVQFVVEANRSAAAE